MFHFEIYFKSCKSILLYCLNALSYTFYNLKVYSFIVSKIPMYIYYNKIYLKFYKPIILGSLNTFSTQFYYYLLYLLLFTSGKPLLKNLLRDILPILI